MFVTRSDAAIETQLNRRERCMSAPLLACSKKVWLSQGRQALPRSHRMLQQTCEDGVCGAVAWGSVVACGCVACLFCCLPRSWWLLALEVDQGD